MKITKYHNYLKKISPLTLLMIIATLTFVVFFATLMIRKSEWIQVEVEISPPDWYQWYQGGIVPSWLPDNINIGDEQYNAFNQKTGEILNIRNYEWSNSNSVNLITEKKTYVTLNLKVERDKKTNKIRYQQQPLEIGKPIDLTFNNTGFKALVTFIEGATDTRVWEEKIVEVKLFQDNQIFPETTGIFTWKADAIEIGDQMKDSAGNTLVEVLDKKVKPAEKIVTTSDGRVFVNYDPLKKDVYLTLKINALKQNGLFYHLGNQKIKVGAYIFIALPNIDFFPEITKIIK
ncbi:MAG: DUF4330 domain-containing protein [Patescibacteria group bacterium]